jgi:hypothetical protein
MSVLLGPLPGTAMNPTRLFLATASLACACACANAAAQAGPARGATLLAMGAAESPANTVVERSDSGGGSGGGAGMRALRGGDVPPTDARLPAAKWVDALPADQADLDPAAPAAATPRRPSYRWQSLVPGAIK